MYTYLLPLSFLCIVKKTKKLQLVSQQLISFSNIIVSSILHNQFLGLLVSLKHCQFHTFISLILGNQRWEWFEIMRVRSALVLDFNNTTI